MSTPKIYLFDSVKKEKVLFLSQIKNKATIYVCGPTVYDNAHLGHARSSIVFDLLHRVLKVNGYEVTMAKNFTDIDDKIVNKIKATGKTLEEITSLYIKNYKNDMDRLNILPNHLEPYATQNIDAMIEMINRLLKDNKAYKLQDGIYLDTSKDKEYGNISHRASDENSQARVEMNHHKKDQKDFTMWKFYDKNEVGFESNFGYGRPGWHIECSAMIDKHLSNHNLPYAIDIHGGGADLLFPHHENEASQTRCCTSQELSKYWMHNGFVNINGKKMSKSLGNSFFLNDVLTQFDGEVIRFYMMTAHYRADFSFSEEDLKSSKKRLDKLYRLKKRLYTVQSTNKLNKELICSLFESLNDDMNTSKALASIDEYISLSNELLDQEPKNTNLQKEIIASIIFINNILGIGLKDAYKYFQFGISETEQETIEKLIQNRNDAKKDKNFELSDKIRNELKSMNISLMDSVSGTLWEKEV